MEPNHERISIPSIIFPPATPLPSFHALVPPASSDYNRYTIDSAPATPIPRISYGSTNSSFQLSHQLQQKLLLRHAAPAEILEQVLDEATAFAAREKEHVRSQLKQSLRSVDTRLTPRDKERFRSRREARVHRVKERAFGVAIKDSLRWIIEHSYAQQSGHSTQAPPSCTKASENSGNCAACRCTHHC